MKEPSFPVYLVEGNDVMVFLSAEDVASQLEPGLVGGDEVVYDAEGRLLRIGVVKDHVHLCSVEGDPVRSAELESVLRNYLAGAKESLAEEASCELACLIELSKKYAVKTRLRDVLPSLWHRK